MSQRIANTYRNFLDMEKRVGDTAPKNTSSSSGLLARRNPPKNMKTTDKYSELKKVMSYVQDIRNYRAEK